MPMKVGYYKIAALAGLLLGMASIAEAVQERYQLILERNPFCAEPVAEMKMEPLVEKADPNFAKHLRLCMLFDDQDGDYRAGFVNKMSNKSFVMSQGETAQGINLLSVNIEENEAIVGMNGLVAQIKLEKLMNIPGAGAPGSASQASSGAAREAMSERSENMNRILARGETTKGEARIIKRPYRPAIRGVKAQGADSATPEPGDDNAVFPDNGGNIPHGMDGAPAAAEKKNERMKTIIISNRTSMPGKYDFIPR